MKSISRANLRVTGASIVFDAALVDSTKDAEASTLTPVGVPTVDASPVLDAVIDTPADQLDGMAAEVVTTDVLVDTRRIHLEVIIDLHGDGHGAVLHELLLHVGDRLDGIRRGREVLVLGVWRRVASIRASGGTLWGVVLLEGIAGWDSWRRGDVVGTSLHGVWLAGGSGANSVIVAASGDTSLGEPLPGARWLTTVAAHGQGAG